MTRRFASPVTRRAVRILLLTAVGLLALEAGLARSAAGPAAGVKKSNKELLADLPAEERIWLTEYVAPIILPEEEKLFLELTESHLRERFKKEFWARREREGLPYPLGTGYEARYPELRRLADEVYDGWRNDAGRMFMRYGEPAEIRKVKTCEHVFRDLEIWTYPGGVQGLGLFLFYRSDELQPRKLWDLNAPVWEIFAGDSCRKRWEDLFADCPGTFQIGDPCKGPVCPEACNVYRIYQAIKARQHNSLGATQERGRVIQPQPVSLEGIERIKDVSPNTSDPNAKPLSVTGPSATVPVPAATAPARAVKKSKKELLADLPAEDRAWLTDYVAPIILPDEEKLFLELSEAYQREIFKKDFWQRREVDSLGAPYGEGFERRYEELRPRLDSEYDGWRHDAAQLVLHYGEPAEIRRPESCNGSVFRDLEIWTVQHVSGTLRQTLHHIFYRSSPLVPRQLWSTETTSLDKRTATGNLCVGNSNSPDNRLFQPGSCRKDFQSLLCDCSPQLGDPCFGPVCSEACDIYKVYQEILARQGSALGALMEKGRLFKLPEVSTEGLETLRKRFATTADPNAKPLSVVGPSTKVEASPAATPTPEPIHALTAEEIRDRIVHLEPKYRQFLDLAGPLLTEDSLQRFLQMTSKEKDRFMKEYWKRRS